MKIQLERFAKVKAETAAEICARVDLSPEARSFLLPDLSPQAFLALVVDNELFADAVRFVAFALPAREGVWWSCVTSRAITTAVTPKSEPCVRLAENWVYEPSDENGQACLSAAETANFDGAGAYAALAAFWAGSSMAPPDAPPLPPDPSLSPTGVGACILLAVSSDDPKRSGRNFEAAIASAIDIANGGNGRVGGADA